MPTRLKSILKYFFYWLLFFQVGRLVFFGITKSSASKFSLQVLVQSMLHGIWLDASIAGYLTLVLCLMLLGGLFAPKVFGTLFKGFQWVVLAVSCLAIISNAVLYLYWATPLDYNALKYLKTPKEAIASINWLYMFLPIAIGVGLYWIFNYLYLQLKLHQIHERLVGNSSYVFQVVMILFF